MLMRHPVLLCPLTSHERLVTMSRAVRVGDPSTDAGSPPAGLGGPENRTPRAPPHRLRPPGPSAREAPDWGNAAVRSHGVGRAQNGGRCVVLSRQPLGSLREEPVKNIPEERTAVFPAHWCELSVGEPQSRSGDGLGPGGSLREAGASGLHSPQVQPFNDDCPAPGPATRVGETDRGPHTPQAAVGALWTSHRARRPGQLAQQVPAEPGQAPVLVSRAQGRDRHCTPRRRLPCSPPALCAWPWALAARPAGLSRPPPCRTWAEPQRLSWGQMWCVCPRP